MSKESVKFAREWLEAKPETIKNYLAIEKTLAQTIIFYKPRLIENFNKVMLTEKFEDGLKKYVDNEKMGNAYRDGVNAKTSFTQKQLGKVENFIDAQRVDITYIISLVYQDYLVKGGNFAYPRYENLPKRFFMEARIGANKILLGEQAYTKGYFELPIKWDNWMRDNFNWISPFSQSIDETPTVEPLPDQSFTINQPSEDE